jgi:hypothetical protein
LAGDPPVDELKNAFWLPLRAFVAACKSFVRGGRPDFSLTEDVIELNDCTVEDLAIWSRLTGAFTFSFLLAFAEVSLEGFCAVLNL